MIIDKALELAIQTTPVTASQATTNVIDLGLADPDLGTYAKRVEVIYIITATGTGTGTVNFTAEDDTAVGMATALRTIAASGAKVATTLVKGNIIRLVLPATHKRYMRGYLTIAGTVGALTYECHINHLV